MIHNDILRGLRSALDLSDAQLVVFFSRDREEALSEEEARALLGKEDDEGSIICSDALMETFLDSLIIDRRGQPRAGSRPRDLTKMTNNAVIKKLRIALSLQEGDMLAILKAGGQSMTKGELTALFRKPLHKHYRDCGDQVLGAFLRGLTIRNSTATAETEI